MHRNLMPRGNEFDIEHRQRPMAGHRERPMAGHRERPMAGVA